MKRSDTNKIPVTRKLTLWVGFIVFIAFIVFSPALSNDFVNWDDYNYIRDNSLIKSFSLSAILNLFNIKTIVMGNYHPLTVLSYMCEYRLAGLNPFLYHFDNVFLHLLNIVLCAWLTWLLTKKYYAGIIAAALFAVHPMRVESVAWASERKDVLYTCFFLFSLIFYIYYSTNSIHKTRNYCLALLFFILSLLSKAQAVVLPLILLTVDYWFGRKLTYKLLAEKIPMLLLSFLTGIMAFVAQASQSSGRIHTRAVPEHLMYSFYNLAAYLFKLIYPYNLSCFYKYPLPGHFSGIIISSVLFLVLLICVVIFFRKNKTIVFGSLFFLLSVFIVIQIFPVGNAIIADRYTYVPFTGLFIMAGLIIDKIISERKRFRNLTISLIILQIVIFSWSSYAQTARWHNGETLWQQAIRHDPDNALAYNNLGNYYLDNNENKKARTELEQVVKYENDYQDVYNAYYGLARVYKREGNPGKAIYYFNKTLTLAPWFTKARTGRGLTYIEAKDYDAAILDFSVILTKFLPGDAETYNNRAFAYFLKQIPDSAVNDYKRAISAKPGYDEAYINMGKVYMSIMKYDDAINALETGLKYIPDEKLSFKGNTCMLLSYSFYYKMNYQSALDYAEKAGSMQFLVKQEYINDLKARLVNQGSQ
ncbi:MAG: tetratricopeptide repeat protein [Bacteroidia bacterium]|nr:tetratricopeptide repeat protein [Bacteroidia bacterium]